MASSSHSRTTIFVPVFRSSAWSIGSTERSRTLRPLFHFSWTLRPGSAFHFTRTLRPRSSFGTFWRIVFFLSFRHSLLQSTWTLGSFLSGSWRSVGAGGIGSAARGTGGSGCSHAVSGFLRARTFRSISSQPTGTSGSCGFDNQFPCARHQILCRFFHIVQVTFVNIWFFAY